MNTTQPRIQRSQPAQEFEIAEGCAILETWNQAGDPAVSIARARVPPRVTTRLHRLEGIEERYLVIAGRGRVDIGNLSPTNVGPGDLVYIPAGCPQRITNLEDSDLIFYAICTPRFVPEAYEDIDEANDHYVPHPL